MPNPYQPAEFSDSRSSGVRTLYPKTLELLVGWGALAFPMALVFVVLGTWLLAYAELGVPPRPGVNDPKSIRSLNMICASELCIIMLVSSPVVAIGGFVSQFLVARRSLSRRLVFAASVASVWLAVIMLFNHEPFQVITWLFD